MERRIPIRRQRRFKVESVRLKEEKLYGKADSDPPPKPKGRSCINQGLAKATGHRGGGATKPGHVLIHSFAIASTIVYAIELCPHYS